MKKVLKVRILVLATILTVITSCSKVFHKEDIGYALLDDQQKKIDLLNGMYARLVEVHNVDYFFAMIRGDDINYYYSWGGDGRYWATNSVIDFQSITNKIYKNLYSLIITANSLLPKLTDTEEDKRIKGEVYFLRAYSYFKLVRLFGNPPLVKDADVSYTFKIPSFVQLYEFIEQDLLHALELLPENPAEVRIPEETPHKGTVKAMLAEVYLSWGGYPVEDESKFDYAVQYAGDVIAKAEHYNIGLLPDIADLWTVRNRHNKENIFGLFFYGGKTILRDKDHHPIVYDFLNNINSYYALSEIHQAFITYIPEFWFYNKFPVNYRKRCFYPVSHDPWRGNFPDTVYNPEKWPGAFVIEMCSYKWLDCDSIEKVKKRMFASFFYKDEGVGHGSHATLYLLRYAQTLLTYAEAKAKSGVLDETAYEAVNMVRRRANKLDIHTPSKFDLKQDYRVGNFIDSVVWERAWELCFEPDGRWFDIVRLNLKKQLYKNVMSNDKILKVPEKLLNEDYWYFYKIPEADRFISN